VFLVESPETYHSAGLRWGTATLKLYEGRDILIGPVGRPLPPRRTRGSSESGRPRR
jgi:hypothetical protein